MRRCVPEGGCNARSMLPGRLAPLSTSRQHWRGSLRRESFSLATFPPEPYVLLSFGKYRCQGPVHDGT